MTTPAAGPRGPRDEYKSGLPDSTTGLRWALAVVSLVAVAATITAVTLWLKPRQVEQAAPQDKAEQALPTKTAPTDVPRADLEQFTGQDLRQRFPGPPIRITCPGDLPAKVGASEECVLRRSNEEFRLTLTITSGTSPFDAVWSTRLGERISN